MEEIKRLVKKQKIEYALLWIIAVVLVCCFETGFLPEGVYAGDAFREYVLETVGILLAVILIPLSLKLYNLALVKRIRNYPLLQALKAYRRWGFIRLLMLALLVWSNLVIYYLTLNSIGGLCALMGLVASFFCWPSTKRVLIELNITEP